MTMVTLIKGSIQCSGLQFQRFSSLLLWWTWQCVEDMILEKELSESGEKAISRSPRQQEVFWNIGCGFSIFENSMPA